MLPPPPPGTQPRACSLTVGSIHPKGHAARRSPPALGRRRAHPHPGGGRGPVPHVTIVTTEHCLDSWGSWASFQGRPAWSPWKAWSPPLGPAPGTQPPFLALTTQGWPVTLGDNSALSARLPCLQRQLMQSGDRGGSPDLLQTHCVTVANLSPLITCGC